MRIITLNVNGIRSAQKKGFFKWLLLQNADIVCLQETRAQQSDMVHAEFFPEGYYYYFLNAQKKGYSGVAIYSRIKPLAIQYGFGWALADEEGRYLQIDFKGLSVASAYLPSGSSGEHRQAIKFEFLDHYMAHLRRLRTQSNELVLCGDWNIAHKPIDLKNWRSNQQNSGFLPEERGWMDYLLLEAGYMDAFRMHNKEADQYTWWSNRGQAWVKNVGWRIDYQIITPGLCEKIQSASIYKQERFSDHAPLIIDYDWIL